ncbi:MAG: hypothetical protein JO104_04515 [Candidatus Eremiobacteraeota bacterium]|nr:hypothetical protein [Candidatus Eremiobacteraeota bacterium]
MRNTACALLALWLASLTPAWGDCKVHRGQHVVLYGTTDDPSVLLWDSRARLREYYAASFDEAQAMLPHAILVPPGTHANVVSCIPSFVDSPIFGAPADAVGVAISSGPEQGLIRWVLGTDVRSAPKSRRKSHP